MLYDTIVVGGGIAGLYCAARLSAKGESVLVLEKGGYLGGRIYTHPKKGYECGAARFHSSHYLLRELVRKYGLKTYALSKGSDFYSLRMGGELFEGTDVFFEEYTKGVVRELRRKVPMRTLKLHTMAEICAKHLTPNEYHLWVDLFGYTSELSILNAYDAIRMLTEEFVGKNYYVVVGGMTQIIKGLERDIKKNKGIIKMNAPVVHVGAIETGVMVRGSHKDEEYIARRCILAVPQLALRSLLPSTRDLQCVQPAPLLRVYAQYKPTRQPNGKTEVWFAGMKRRMTDSFLRYIIPIREDTGMIMVSYTDGLDTEMIPKGEVSAKKTIQKELKAMCPDRNIPDPFYFKMHMWPDGAYYWKGGCDSGEVSERMIQPMGKKMPLYVCGESFSRKQAWVEGALETARNVLRRI